MFHHDPDGVLAVVDRSDAASHAAWRAARLAAAHRKSLRLLHVASGEPDAARLLLEKLARELADHFGIEVAWDARRGDPLRETLQAARASALMVIGSARRNALAEFLLGTPAERLIRMARVPVLVVKRPPTGAYRRLLVPVRSADDGPALISAALGISGGAEIEVFHALSARHEISLRAAEVPEPVLRRARERALQHAHAALDAMVAAAGGRARTRTRIGFGQPANAALERESAAAADLVVIGKRRRMLLADFFLGNVTQRVLADSRADVLVLPLARPGRAIKNIAAEAQPVRASGLFPSENRAGWPQRSCSTILPRWAPLSM